MMIDSVSLKNAALEAGLEPAKLTVVPYRDPETWKTVFGIRYDENYETIYGAYVAVSDDEIKHCHGLEKMQEKFKLAQYGGKTLEKIKNNAVIQDAIRNCRERGLPKEHAQAIVGAPYEVVDKIYREKTPHDTSKRHGDDD